MINSKEEYKKAMQDRQRAVRALEENTRQGTYLSNQYRKASMKELEYFSKLTDDDVIDLLNDSSDEFKQLNIFMGITL